MKVDAFKPAIIMLCLFMYQHATCAAPAQHEPVSDIRILIDVSGSMKWNDPGNLRSPALRLVTGLLPKGTWSGVWTFGKFVNMLVPYQEVDEDWKEHARQAAAQLHSKGLFTNIEDTLNKATWDWNEPANNTERSIILLTDGLVDISKDTAENNRSRSRILDEILPRLQQSQVTIYTIALSGEADNVLLQQLAAATNGWYEKADTAETLDRIFFRMFEKAANPETLPMVDNNVLVDDSIEEVTMLVFRKDDASQSQIVAPDKRVFGEDTAPDNVSWHHEQRYDLITIKNPMGGTWHVNAEVDPDNRVMVVTNLKMLTTSLPNNISTGDEYTLNISLTQEGKIIEKKEFLHFIRATLTQQTKDRKWEWMLLDNGRDEDEVPGDGIYTVHLDKTLTEGEHTLTVNVDGTTFKRVHRQIVNIYDSPVMTAITPTTDGFSLSVTPRAGMIDPDSMTIHAIITGKEGARHAMEVPRINSNEWRLSLADFSQHNRNSAEIEISGVRPSGKPVSRHIGPLYFGEASDPAVEKVAGQATETPASHDNSSDARETEVKEMDVSINWPSVSIQVLVFNLLFAAVIFFGLRLWRKNSIPPATPWSDLVHE